MSRDCRLLNFANIEDGVAFVTFISDRRRFMRRAGASSESRMLLATVRFHPERSRDSSEEQPKRRLEQRVLSVTPHPARLTLRRFEQPESIEVRSVEPATFQADKSRDSSEEQPRNAYAKDVIDWALTLERFTV